MMNNHVITLPQRVQQPDNLSVVNPSFAVRITVSTDDFYIISVFHVDSPGLEPGYLPLIRRLLSPFSYESIPVLYGVNVPFYELIPVRRMNIHDIRGAVPVCMGMARAAVAVRE